MLYQGDVNIFYDMLQKIFDLSINEENEYRPRILSFLVQWIDVNIADRIVTHFPGMSLRFYMGLIGSVFTVFFSYKILCFGEDDNNKQSALLMSVLLLYTPAMLSSSILILRSAKIIVAAVCLALIYVFIKYKNIYLKQFSFSDLFLAIIFFLLLTIDEQAICVCMFLCTCCFLFSLKEAKINKGFYIFSLSLFLYVIWNMLLGKFIFSIFTKGIIKPHRHQFSDVFNTADIFLRIKESTMIFYENIVGSLHTIGFVVILISVGFVFIRNTSQQKMSNYLFFGISISLPICLIFACISSHNYIIILPDLHQSIYTLPSIIIFLVLIMKILVSNFNLNKYLSRIIICTIIITMIIHTINFDKYQFNYCYNKYNSIHGLKQGHLRCFQLDENELEKRNSEELIFFKSYLKDKHVTNCILTESNI